MSVNWRGWLGRRVFGLQPHVDRDTWLSAFRQGAATIIPKRADMSTAEYRAMLNEQAEPAYARLLASPPPVIEAETPTFEQRNGSYVPDIRTQHEMPKVSGELWDKWRRMHGKQGR